MSTDPAPNPENASQKRGRPRLFPQVWEDAMEGFGAFSGSNTRRSRTNYFWTSRAVRVLFMPEDEEEKRRRREDLRWLMDEDAVSAGKPRAWRKTLMSELGRVADPDEMLELARRLCEVRPSVKVGVAQVRRYRLGRAPDGGDLLQTLIRTTDDYMITHPNTTWAQVRAAVGELLQAVGIAEAGEQETYRR